MIIVVSNNLRISGLASGMDTEKMVSDLMKAKRIPLDKLKQKKQVLEWQRDGYREMNTLLLNFRTEAFNMKLTSGYRTKTVTSSDEARVTAIANTSAGNASYSITKVDQLATAATKVSGAITVDDPSKALFLSNLGTQISWKQGSVETTTLTVGADKTATINLPSGVLLKKTVPIGDPNYGTAPADLSEMVVKVNGTAYKLVNSGTPAADEVSVDPSGKLTFGTNVAVGSSVSVNYYTDIKQEKFKPAADTSAIQLSKGSISDGSVSISFGATTYKSGGNGDPDQLDATKIYDSSDTIVGNIDASTGKITLNPGKEIAKDTDVTVEYKQNYFTFGMTTNTSKGQVTEKFGIQGSESLNQVLQKMNNSSLGVSAFYDSVKDKISLTRTETGNFNAGDEMITTDGFLSNVLKFSGVAETGGENALFTVNGLSTERTTNSFDMNGVSITLKQAFTPDKGAVSLSINNNVDAVVDKVKKFVETYNDAVKKILDKVSEPYYKDYQPLTDDQREQLSDKQEEQWEEKSKSGLLRRDSMLTGVLDKMRLDFSTAVNGDGMNYKYTQMSSIGITTTANYLEGGKLILDEDKLRKALQDDFSSVEKLFSSTGTSNSQQGIASRLYDSINATMDKIKLKAGNSFSTSETFTIGKNLKRIDSDIITFEDRLKQTEDRYWRQFSAMEEAINKSNGQSASLMSMFGGK